MEVLQATSLSRNFSEVRALNDFSYNFTPGIYGLLGPNGAGKSTLLRLLCGLDQPTKGVVTFNQLPVESKEYRQLLGYMPQYHGLKSNMKVYRFLDYCGSLKGLPRGLRKERIEEMIHRFQLESVTGTPLYALSGGNRQRVLLAQAFLNHPKVLILDEPTSGLDPLQRRGLRLAISSLAAGSIVILATHMTSDLEQLAGKILILEKGKLLTSQDPGKLIEEIQVYFSMDSPENLKKMDPELRILDSVQVADGLRTRFLSKKAHEKWTKLPAILDDVYMEWLDHA